LCAKRLKSHLLVFIFYALTAVTMTWPLAVNLSTHIPGGGVDEAAFLWNLWWARYSLLELGTNPLYSDYIFFPLGADLALYTSTLLNGLVSIPLQLVLGPVVANNILLFLLLALSGLGMYLLALWVLLEKGLPSGVSLGGSLLAGLVYAYAGGKLAYAALGQFNYTSLCWLPLFVLFFLKLSRKGVASGGVAPDSRCLADTGSLPWPVFLLAKGRYGILAALFALFAAYTELNFLLFLVLFVALYLLFELWAHRRRGLTWLSWGPFLVLGLVFGLGFAPLLLAVVGATRAQGDLLLKGWGGAERYSADLLGLFIPNSLHPLLGRWAQGATERFTDINFSFMGYTVLILGLATMLKCWRRTRTWGLLALSFFLLSLGPVLHINGQWEFDLDGLTVNLPLPYLLLHYLPFVQGARIPNRFGIMLTMALAVVVAYGAAQILARVRGLLFRSAVTGVLAALILFENMVVSLPLTDVGPPPIYRAMAAIPGDFTVLELPVGWRHGFGRQGEERTILQAYQAVHQKRLLNGNTSRVPDFTLEYFSRLPVISTLLSLQDGKELDPAVAQFDRAVVEEVLSFLDVGYVVVHSPLVSSSAEEYLRSIVPMELVDQGQARVKVDRWRYDSGSPWVERTTETVKWAGYRVRRPGSGSTSAIDFGTALSSLYRGEGWSWNEEGGGVDFNWAVAGESWVMFREVHPTGLWLKLRVAPFVYPGSPRQHMRVWINGQFLGQVELEDTWKVYSLEVPGRGLRTGINRLRFRFSHLASPRQVIGSDDRRSLAVAFDWIRFERHE